MVSGIHPTASLLFSPRPPGSLVLYSVNCSDDNGSYLCKTEGLIECCFTSWTVDVHICTTDCRWAVACSRVSLLTWVNLSHVRISWCFKTIYWVTGFSRDSVTKWVYVFWLHNPITCDIRSAGKLMSVSICQGCSMREDKPELRVTPAQTAFLPTGTIPPSPSRAELFGSLGQGEAMCQLWGPARSSCRQGQTTWTWGSPREQDHRAGLRSMQEGPPVSQDSRRQGWTQM